MTLNNQSKDNQRNNGGDEIASQPIVDGHHDHDDDRVSQESTPLLYESAVFSPSKRPSAENGSSFSSRINNSVRSAASDSLRKASSRLLQSMSTTQREHAMTLGLGPAAFLIKDAVIGQQDAPYEGWYDPYTTFGQEYDELRNLISVVCGRMIAMTWVKSLLCYAPNWILFTLSFIEPPQWCRDSDLTIATNNPSDSLREYGDCNIILNSWGLTADGLKTDQLYPNSSSMWISVTQSKQIELLCVGVVAFWMLLELGRDGMDSRLFFYKGPKRVLHFIRCCCLVALLAGSLAENTTFNPFFRMLLLASHLRTFQVELLSVARMVGYNAVCCDSGDLQHVQDNRFFFFQTLFN
jgi:hypothetical protein